MLILKGDAVTREALTPDARFKLTIDPDNPLTDQRLGRSAVRRPTDVLDEVIQLDEGTRERELHRGGLLRQNLKGMQILLGRHA